MYQLWSNKKLKKVAATATLAAFAATGMITPAFAADSTHITEAQQAEFSDNSWIQKQVDVEKAIAQEFEVGEYTMANPLVKVNPYENNYLSALVLFETEVPTTVTAEVLIPEDKSGAYDEYCKFVFEFDELSTKHTLPVSALFLGANKVELTATDEAGNVEKQIVEITIELDGNAGSGRTDIQEEGGSGTKPISERKGEMLQFDASLNPAKGLTFLTIADHGITAYDFNGNVRAAFNDDSAAVAPIKVLDNGHVMYCGKALHGMYYAWVMEADMMGKIYKKYLINGIHHEYMQLENGNWLFNTELPNGHTVEDYFVEVDAETGAVVRDWWVRDSFDLKEYISDCNYKYSSEDWAHINSYIQIPGEDSILLSCRRVNSVYKLNLTTNEMEWLISEPDPNYTEETNAKMLTPVVIQEDGTTVTVQEWWKAHPQNTTGADVDWSNPKDPYFQLEDCPFQYMYGQHAINLLPNGDIYLFDNGTGLSKNPETVIERKDGVSRGVVYRVDEEAGTVAQVWDWSRDDLYTFAMGDIDYLGDNHYILDISTNFATKQAVVVELVDDKVASEMTFTQSAYRQERIDVAELAKVTGEHELGVVEGVQLGELLMDRAVLPGADLETVEMHLGEKAYITYSGGTTMDTAAYADGDKAMVPVRYVANALSADVAWDAASETATITKGDVKATFTEGAGQIVIKDNRLMVPMAAVAEALDVPMTFADGVVTFKR